MNHPRKLNLFDTSGRSIRLGNEVGRGGEGSVFEVISDADHVAKIYHTPLSPEKAEKIRLMSKLRSTELLALAAWPLDLLLTSSGEPIGLVMPKVSGRKDIHRLYSPKSRRDDFQRADWRFLIRTAANTARAFAAIHEKACVIGDVNHGSILVAQDSTVRLIDCDSFQVTTERKRFLCEVGVETFTPPELQSKSFKGIVRTPNHDNFGLAILIFLILFMGRHPFSGRYLGAGDMSIAKAIEQHRFAYGERRRHRNMEQPPGTPPLRIVGDALANLFELAFSKQTDDGARPTARDWVAALERLEKNTCGCKSSPSHWYLKSLNACPWCIMEAATGLLLFPIVIQAPIGAPFDIGSLWRQIEAIGHPGPAPGFAMSTPHEPSDEAKAISFRGKIKNWAAGIAAAAIASFGLFGLGEWFFILGGIGSFFFVRSIMNPSEQIEKLRKESEAAYKTWRTIHSDWEIRAGPVSFDKKKSEMVDLRRRWQEIPNLRLKKLDQLNREHRARQLRNFLDSFEIDNAKIEGIGPGRKRTLESYGIETADDIEHHKIETVPGFGPVLISSLLKWRHALEARFKFDPKKPIEPRDIANVEQAIIRERHNIESALIRSHAELVQISNQIRTARQIMLPHVEASYRNYMIALAEYETARTED